MGLVGALIAFLWQIWGLISSYQVGELSANSVYCC